MNARTSFAIATTLLVSAAHAQTELRSYVGDTANHLFGLSVDGAGDVDSDGYDDVVIGVRGDGTNGAQAGAARVYSGQTGALLHEFFGDSSYDYFGLSVAGVGDVNGDGVADVAVGAPRDDSHISGGNSGSVFVYSGLDGSLIHRVRGDSPGEEFGRFVDGCGDVNGDGFDDFVVGAPFADDNGLTNAGSAHVVSGLDGTFLLNVFGAAAGDEFGRSLGGAGDVNADGTPDFVVGARLHDTPNADAGAAYVFSGVDGSQLHSFFGSAANDQFGQSARGAGDVDRDGHADIIVGAHLADAGGLDAGRTVVFSGQSGLPIHTFDGSAGDNLGRSVDSAGDVDGDGHADLVIGADLIDRAFVMSGQTGLELFHVDGSASGDLFGHAVAGAGDLDSDGFADLIVGAYREDDAASETGGARTSTRATPSATPRWSEDSAARVLVRAAGCLGSEFAVSLRSMRSCSWI